MIKYAPNHVSYIRTIDAIIPYNPNSIGLHFNHMKALEKLDIEMKNVDVQINKYGSYAIDQILYNNIMTDIFLTEETYHDKTKHLGFQKDIRKLYRFPYIWDLVHFCNIYNLDPISFGIFKELKLGFW